MGLAGAIVRNYSSMAKVALPAGFSIGLFYSLALGSSPLSDAKQAALGGERGAMISPLSYRVRLGSASGRTS